jgi:hypothetical protein
LASRKHRAEYSLRACMQTVYRLDPGVPNALALSAAFFYNSDAFR